MENRLLSQLPIVLHYQLLTYLMPHRFASKKELSLYASRLNCAMFPTVIDWIERGLVDLGHIITHTFDFHSVANAFQMAEGSPRESCKVLLDFGSDA